MKVEEVNELLFKTPPRGSASAVPGTTGNTETKLERLLLTLLKQEDGKIVELEGIIKNLQYHFTVRKHYIRTLKILRAHTPPRSSR